ncbi:MAG: MFS transporter [Oscillospiraceae bacterium]|nr:MFS transporter [Oscillospiraceae bacterium]
MKINKTNSRLYYIYNLNDEKAKGRCVMLASSLLSTIITYFSSGVFYTAFMRLNDISMSDMGIITYLPILANCFSLFSPMFLERFAKRRWVLVPCRLFAYAISTLGILVLPDLINNTEKLKLAFAFVLFISNAIHAMLSSGWSVWHVNFIPPETRNEFFSFNQIITACVSGVVLLGSGFLADALKGTPYELEVIKAMRIAAFVVAMFEALVLLSPKEYSYEDPAKKGFLVKIFTLPVKNRKFMATMYVILMWSFMASLTSSSMTYYLLDIGLGFSLISAVDVSYSLFLLFISPIWRRLLNRWGWIETFGVTILMDAPITFLYSFVTKSNYFWIYPAVRLTQHALGVGMNLSWANLPYLNLPENGKTYFFSFYSFTTNLATFFGVVCGAVFISISNNGYFTIFGSGEISAVRLLMISQAIIQPMIAIYIFKNRKTINPES